MMAQEDVAAAANCGATVVEESGTFTAYQLIVDAQKVGDAFAFYNAVFDAVETRHSLHPKRKADQELSHLLFSELNLSGTTVVASDVSVKSGSDAKTCTMPAILETDDVEAAVTKAVAVGAVRVEEEFSEVQTDGGVKRRVTDPFDFTCIFGSPAKESEKDDNSEFVFCGISGMVLEMQSETCPAVKRRRMLHFDDQPMETSFFRPESSILKSSEGFDLNAAEWYAECLNDPESPTLPDDLEALDQYAAEWSAGCLNDPQTQTVHDDLYNVPETSVVRRPVTRFSPNVIFKGMKSFARPVTKLSSSFICPFTLIKPYEVHGVMTLTDINQKIRTPAAKPKEDKAELPVIQTSVHSGKPILRKIKFLTEGGRGNITVMTTRG